MTTTNPKQHTRDIGRLYLRADLVPGSVDIQNRTVDFIFSAGARVQMYPWWDEPFLEQLSMDPTAIRMAFFESGRAPFLEVHNRYELEGVIGVVQSARLEGGKLTGKVKFSAREDVAPILQDIKDGILCNASMGYRVYTYRDITQPGDAQTTLLAIDWEPFEGSLVPIGADPEAHTRGQVGEEKHRCEFILRADSALPKGDPMTNPRPATQTTPETPATAPTVDNAAAVTNARSEAATAERTRAAAIAERVKTAKLPEAFALRLITDGTTLDQARDLIIDELAKKDSPGPSRTTRIEGGELDEKETRKRALEVALHHRLNSKTELIEPAREFRGMSLLRIAEHLLGRAAHGLNRSEIAVRALGTTDLPSLLANVANKRLRENFDVQPQTFKPMCSFGTLPDYKEGSLIATGLFPSLKPVNEDGEYDMGYFGDGAEKIKVARYGILMGITEETIVNDDLRGVDRVVGGAGRASARLESKLFWDVPLTNPALADSVALFHATHGNLAGSGTDVTDTAMSAMKQAIRAQKDIDGKDFLDLVPKFLIVGPAKEMAARRMLSALLVATKTADINVWANSMDLIVESRITGNQWFAAVDPGQYESIAMYYLEGEDGPRVESQWEFKGDRVMFKVRHVVGVKAVDYRGIYKNPGA